jgi:hypothetical protein
VASSRHAFRCSLGNVVIATDHEVLAQLLSAALAEARRRRDQDVVNQMEVGHQTATATAIDEWLTVADVAAWLKVSKSWVYEHSRRFSWDL